MSTSILVPPGYDIIEEIVTRLSSQNNDYSGSLIVFPGKRPGYYLRKKIGSGTNAGYIPPAVMSMDEFVDYIYENELQITDRKIDSIDAAAILYDIHKSTTVPLGGDNFKRVDDFLPLAMNIFKELEEFCIADISVESLQQTLSGYDAEQLGTLASYYTKFYEKAASENYSTRSLRYRQIANSIDNIELHRFSHVIFAGFFVLTKSERGIFSGLLKRDDTLIIFQDGKGMREHLSELRIQPEEIECETSTPVVRFHKSSDTHGQVFALSELIKKLNDQKVTLDEKMVIVTPAAETLFPLIQNTLSLIKDNNYNISLGYPASRSTIHGFISSMMNAIISRDEGKYNAPEYLRFALHPYTKNMLLNHSSEPSRILFHALEDHFTENAPLSFFDLSEIESDTSFFKEVEARATGAEFTIPAEEFQSHLIHLHTHTLRSIEAVSSVGEFSKKLIEIILFINNHSTAKQHPLFNHFSGHLIESISALQNSLLSDISFDDPEAYLKFYNHYVQEIQIPFAGTPLSGLQVLGFLETRSLKFDRVFFLDANDDIISGMRNDESLVPNRVRKELGIPAYRERERLYAYYLDLLVHHAREVDFFYIEKDKKERSRYLEQLAWNAEKAGKHIDTDSIRYNIKLTNTEPSPIPKTGGILPLLNKMKYSATSLDTYLKCPLRFYYRYVIKLRERDEITEDVDNLQIGSIVHTVLKRYFTPRKGIVLSPDDISAEEMQKTVEEVFTDLFGNRISGKIYVLRQQIIRRMEEFLRAYQIPLTGKAKVKILDVETPFETEHNGYKLTGTIDRIEKRDEAVYILDFKISGNADRLRIRFDKLNTDDRSTWYNAIGSLQLPVYMLLYESDISDPPPSLNPAFVLLGKQRIGPDIDINLLNMMRDPSVELIQIKEVINRLIYEITNPEIDFQPTEDFAAECPNCPYKFMCGTQWTG